jgi:hypothetical protein
VVAPPTRRYEPAPAVVAPPVHRRHW